MSVFADYSHLGLIVAMSGMAAVSGLITTWSIRKEDAGAAWVWASVFGATSLVAAGTSGRIV